MTLEEINGEFNTVGLIAAMGMKAETWDPGAQALTLSMPYSALVQGGAADGHFHGGAIGALADTAATYAVLAAGAENAPTSNYRVDFLRPATGPALRAVATVRRLGRTIAMTDVDVFGLNDKLVATLRLSSIVS
ncbi:MAG: PaaI family thioesterase [Pseudomonadota bacterium]